MVQGPTTLVFPVVPPRGLFQSGRGQVGDLAECRERRLPSPDVPSVTSTGVRGSEVERVSVPGRTCGEYTSPRGKGPETAGGARGPAGGAFSYPQGPAGSDGVDSTLVTPRLGRQTPSTRPLRWDDPGSVDKGTYLHSFNRLSCVWTVDLVRTTEIHGPSDPPRVRPRWTRARTPDVHDRGRGPEGTRTGSPGSRESDRSPPVSTGRTVTRRRDPILEEGRGGWAVPSRFDALSRGSG